MFLELLFSREDESQPGARGAWSFSELNSLALLIWSLTCAGLTFCLSSHLLRSHSLFLFFFAFSYFQGPLASFLDLFDLTCSARVFLQTKVLRLRLILSSRNRIYVSGTCYIFFSFGSDISIQADSHVFLRLILTCFSRVLFMHYKFCRALLDFILGSMHVI